MTEQPRQMKGIVYTKLGPPEVLVLEDVAQPVPGDAEVRVRVRAAGINALDVRRFSSQLVPGPVPLATRLMDRVLFKAVGTVLGADIAGVVDRVGGAVRRFRPGDAVFGVTVGARGGFAQYACAHEDHLAPMPPKLSFEAAAAVPMAALTALQCLRHKGRVRAGQKVLVYGASGGVGTFALQLARSFGAEVTAVTSARNLDLARSLGAACALDYARDDFAAEGRRFDVIVAVNGQRSLWEYRRALAAGGRCEVIGGTLGQIGQAILLGPLVSLAGSRKVRFMGIARANRDDLAFLAELLEQGEVVPIVERRYELAAAAQAVRYLAQGHASGKLVLTVD